MPQTSRRVYPRQLRRLAVRFWRHGEERPRQGFTKNVSLTGAFVSTPDPAGRGERLRLELSDAGRTAQLYAVVVHAHRVPPELRRFAESAMGLRFLGLDEVVGPFLGEEALQPEAAVGRGAASAPTASSRMGGERLEGGGTGANRTSLGSAAGGTRVGSEGGAGDNSGAPSGGEPEAASGTGAFRAAGQPATGAFPSGGGAEAPAGGRFGREPSPAREPAAASPAPGPGVTYALSFASADDFLAVYRRDVANGGLFVTAERPARLDQRVAVDLRLPGAGAPTVRVEGRVVQVVEPRPLDSGRTAGGMGLELIDPDGVVQRLAPHVAAYDR